MSASACEDWEFREIRALVKELIRDVRDLARDMEEKAKAFREYVDRLEESIKNELKLSDIRSISVLLREGLYDIHEIAGWAYDGARNIAKRSNNMIMRECEEKLGGAS